MKKIIYLTLGGLIFLTVFTLGGLVCLAQGTGIGISPLIFKYSLDKGDVQKGTINVTNPNDFEIGVKSEIEDFLPEGEIGGTKLIGESQEITSLFRWIKVDPDSFNLVAKEMKTVSFEIAVPEDAEPSGHYASILFRAVPPEKEGKETTIRVSGRVGALILVEVSGKVLRQGEIVSFKVPSFVEKGPINFSASLKNTGTVHWQAKGTVKISNWFGKKVAEVPLGEHIVLPQGSRLFEGSLDKKYLLGKYKAELEFRADEDLIFTAQDNFWAFPWIEALGLLVIITLLVLGIRTLKKKVKITIVRQKREEEVKEETKKTKTWKKEIENT